MCRLAAYLGPETGLNNIVFDANHSLEKQAWQPRELREARLNADGFGLGWYNDNAEVARYRQSLPIWGDPNLQDFCHSLQRSLWLCYIRSATPGLGTCLSNTQPFFHNSWQFLHNGYIHNFNADTKSKIRQFLPTSSEALIEGNTDSEYLFVLILHYFQQTEDMPDAIRKTFKQLKQWLGNERALLNVVLSDGVQIIASCYAINGDSPTLYYGKDIDGQPKTSQLLVSERLNGDKHWQAVPPGSLIHLRADIAVEITKL